MHNRIKSLAVIAQIVATPILAGCFYYFLTLYIYDFCSLGINRVVRFRTIAYFRLPVLLVGLWTAGIFLGVADSRWNAVVRGLPMRLLVSLCLFLLISILVAVKLLPHTTLLIPIIMLLLIFYPWNPASSSPWKGSILIISTIIFLLTLTAIIGEIFYYRYFTDYPVMCAIMNRKYDLIRGFRLW